MKLPGKPRRERWAWGLCAGMHGCAWAQHGKDHRTWVHFPNAEAARRYVMRREQLARIAYEADRCHADAGDDGMRLGQSVSDDGEID